MAMADETGGPARILIVGQGYVGTMLARSCLDSGLEVHGVDPSEHARQIAMSKFAADSSYSVGKTVEDFDVVIIAVNTPLDGDGQPDLEPLLNATTAVASALQPGSLVLVESTVPPGTTARLERLLAERANLRLDEFDIACSPERVDPGNREWTLRNTPKLVGADAPRALERACNFYRSMGVTVHALPNTRDVEFAKLAENTFRAVAIAFVNELAQVARKLDVDIRSALDAAATKPYGYMDFRPGPGVGGDCIPTDPTFIVAAAREHGATIPSLIERALELNDGLPDRVADRILELLADLRPVAAATVLLVGLAHKPGDGDLTNAPSLRIARCLHDKGVNVWAVDHRVDRAEVPGFVQLDHRDVSEPDLTVVLTLHDELNDLVASTDSPILDVRAQLDGTNIHRL